MVIGPPAGARNPQDGEEVLLNQCKQHAGPAFVGLSPSSAPAQKSGTAHDDLAAFGFHGRMAFFASAPMRRM
jgi:hypothetical protein